VNKNMRPLAVLAVVIWLALLLLPMIALAQVKVPPCMPAEIGGAGTRSLIDLNARGAAAGWWCREPRAVVVAAATWAKLAQPDHAASLVSAAAQPDRAAAISAMWQASAQPLTAVPVDLYAPLLARLAATAPPPVVERWAVPKASISASPPGTRPTYRLAPTPTLGAGELIADGGRVAEGAPCDLALARHAQGLQTFGSVLGQAAKLALCAKAAP
jgi:hypothetical protein